ncbi:MAG: cell filamentation protein Fic, partial [Gemmatimonadetes bacterium]|nr:cell filamentation protein Fic [Gemmatimonadota bacterium]
MSRVLRNLPEAFVSHTAISRAVSRAVKAGRLRKHASRLYESNLDAAAEESVGRIMWGL